MSDQDTPQNPAERFPGRRCPTEKSQSHPGSGERMRPQPDQRCRKRHREGP
ncbi:hypothetical protein ACIQOV_06250 [Kitasatospora sp. NPDC091257]|uniref:hypothetical protein n=1 Tax=Kitasatospora sp. NPDC091257 TaxID=3364084 RepID=UPI00381008E7